MKFLIVSLTLAFLLIGCATPPKITFSKPGSTQDEYNRDIYECTQQSRVSWAGGGTGSYGLAIMAIGQSSAQKQANRLFKMCMEARGWTATVEEK